MTAFPKALALAVGVMLLAAPRAFAWDEVVHGRLTEAAIADVRTPALKQFLQAHRDAVISGAWWPDWGHALKPQGEAGHSFYLDAAHDDLDRPEVRAQANYPDLLAHYMGAYAHVVEDRVVDSTLKLHAKEVGEGRRDDMENGILEIAGQGWLKTDFKLVVPWKDEARIYANADYFHDPRLNAANFAGHVQRALDRGEVQNRRLTLLSFLAGGYARRLFPWGAANVPVAPGGFSSNEKAVAAGWEAIWAEAQGRPAPFFVYSLPSDGEPIASADPAGAYGRIVVVTRRRFDTRKLSCDHVQLVSDQGESVPIRVEPYIDEPDLYSYRPQPGHHIDLAFGVRPLRALKPAAWYSLTIQPGDYAPNAGAIAPYRIRFSVPPQPLFQARSSAPRPWAMGLFLFTFVGAAAGMAFGLPDVARLARRPATAGAVRDPAWFMALNGLFKTLALALAALALWLLFTDGAAFIEFLRHHH